MTNQERFLIARRAFDKRVEQQKKRAPFVRIVRIAFFVAAGIGMFVCLLGANATWAQQVKDSFSLENLFSAVSSTQPTLLD